MPEMKIGGWIPKCNPCVAEYIDARNKAGPAAEVTELPEIHDAATLAPQWQSQSSMGQMMFACVAVPVCMEKHLAPVNPNSIAPASAFGIGKV
jgi:hypothetical protein